MLNSPEIKALLFGVFGTVVDWRSGDARDVGQFLGRHAVPSSATLRSASAYIDWCFIVQIASSGNRILVIEPSHIDGTIAPLRERGVVTPNKSNANPAEHTGQQNQLSSRVWSPRKYDADRRWLAFRRPRYRTARTAAASILLAGSVLRPRTGNAIRHCLGAYLGRLKDLRPSWATQEHRLRATGLPFSKEVNHGLNQSAR
ncbi:hypothetical protein ACFQI9_30465 [Paraburkholderia dipogonis]|uniref:hypothetical protein n=1 Tax=Paraburkholderia dipogonis TaxID=1211383 RepID=UPI003619CC72